MATGLTPNLRTDRIFECPSFVYNEVYQVDGQPRPHWLKFLHALKTAAPSEFARRNGQADRMLRENGVNYHSATDSGEGARPWRLDLLPMLKCMTYLKHNLSYDPDDKVRAYLS